MQPEPAIRPLQAGDRPELLALMARLCTVIGGLSTAGMHEAIVGAALRRASRLRIQVAPDGAGVIAGFVICVIDPERFWTRFFGWHPWLYLQRVLKRRGKSLGVTAAGGAEGTAPAIDVEQLLAEPSERRWGESAADLAQLLIFAVAPEARGSGLGARLVRAALLDLASSGVRRVDGRIGLENYASVKTCARLGWRIERRPGGFFMSIDLPEQLRD